MHAAADILNFPGYALICSNFQVLRDTKAPAVLIEHAFHDNPDDLKKLKDKEWRRLFALADAIGIANYLNVDSSSLKQIANKKQDMLAALAALENMIKTA